MNMDNLPQIGDYDVAYNMKIWLMNFGHITPTSGEISRKKSPSRSCCYILATLVVSSVYLRSSRS